MWSRNRHQGKSCRFLDDPFLSAKLSFGKRRVCFPVISHCDGAKAEGEPCRLYRRLPLPQITSSLNDRSPRKQQNRDRTWTRMRREEQRITGIVETNKQTLLLTVKSREYLRGWVGSRVCRGDRERHLPLPIPPPQLQLGGIRTQSQGEETKCGEIESSPKRASTAR